MKTSFRDNALAKNRLLLKLTLLWAMSVSVISVLLACLCFYVVFHKQTHWLPICANAEFSVSASAYSPEYLKEMTQKVADLRLTYNPDTIDSRYATLSHVIDVRHQNAFKQTLDAERNVVHSKNISSVFYAEQVHVDANKGTGDIHGMLARTSHGLQLTPQHKIYQLQFSFHNGLLGLQSIKEITDAKTH